MYETIKLVRQPFQILKNALSLLHNYELYKIIIIFINILQRARTAFKR